MGRLAGIAPVDTGRSEAKGLVRALIEDTEYEDLTIGGAPGDGGCRRSIDGSGSTPDRGRIGSSGGTVHATTAGRL